MINRLQNITQNIPSTLSKILFIHLLLTLSFCCSESTAKELTTPIIKEGMTEPVPEFKDPKQWIRHQLWVETEFDSDGDGRLDRMHVGVTRPKQTENKKLKLPVIYESSPYFNRTASIRNSDFWDVRHELCAKPPNRDYIPTFKKINQRSYLSNAHISSWVPHGYAVIHSSSPGTGLSQGCPTIGRKNESLAPKAVIDWLNGRAKGYTTVDGNEEVHAFWSTGKVGMTGTSHPGTLALAAASTGVEGLEVIIPIAPNTSAYHYYRSNGLVRHPFGYVGEDIDCMYDFVVNGNSDRREYCEHHVRDQEMLEGIDRVTGDFNDFWAKRDYLTQLDSLKAAVLMAHGLNDWNVVPEHSNRIYQALKEKKVPCQIYYHQGGHGGEPPHSMMNRWFAHYLHGVDNDIQEGPHAWIVREKDLKIKPTAYADYPNPKAQPVKLHLLAGSPERGKLSTAASDQPSKETLIDNFSFSGATLAKAESTDHRLMYVSPTLTQPLHISGSAKINIKLASSKPAVNLSVWLVSLPWNNRVNAEITENIITRGWADPQNYRSITEGEPLEPGKFYELSFDLQPDDQIIPVGQQLGLMIFSSDRDFTLRPDPGTRLTVDLEATHLTLPVVGGLESYKDSFGK
jgi:X-Pro dipeptidyl-peptidase